MKNKLKSFLILALAVLCMQTTFLNTVFCIESDGHSQIEFSQLGSCNSTEFSKEYRLSPGNEDSCENCTDIPLKTEVLSKYNTGKKEFNQPAFQTQELIFITQNQVVFALNQRSAANPIKSDSYKFYPHQYLQSIILII
tara:strand:+ start:52 stop:468 length:417 start_codon:yes stop_codon:yes gene_type:complete